ncbi:MAG: ABC transporter ATP-binding protein [Acidobacteria bacterium]|nr:ABC transporter ATP-binding protein [Acidobacteriota bacterium]
MNDNRILSQCGSDSVMIRVTNLTKRFGDLIATDSLSFDIYKNEIFGFLGPNGAGKTTTINMICGLIVPTDGEIEILGKRNRDKSDIKTLIGICPQENIYWPKLTCLEQLVFLGEMYGMNGKAAKKRSLELLQWMGLEGKVNALADTLSGGMKRRLNICLALVHDPQILVLDEPEAGLDPQSRIMVRNFIKNLAKERTIILTTHNMDEADRLANRVAIIDYGKLLLLDTPYNLKKSIGIGDVLEIALAENNKEKFPILKENLAGLYEHLSLNGSNLVIKARNLIEHAADITSRIKELGFKINEMIMRENTLEDVFIHLTGRKLRQ